MDYLYMSTGPAAGVSLVEQRWGISKEELDRRQRMHPEPQTKRERNCPDCGRRVTKTKSGMEAGHTRGRKAPTCPHYDGPHDADSDVDNHQTSLSSY